MFSWIFSTWSQRCSVSRKCCHILWHSPRIQVTFGLLIQRAVLTCYNSLVIQKDLGQLLIKGALHSLSLLWLELVLLLFMLLFEHTIFRCIEGFWDWYSDYSVTLLKVLKERSCIIELSQQALESHSRKWSFWWQKTWCIKGISRGPEALHSHMDDFYFTTVLSWP